MFQGLFTFAFKLLKRPSLLLSPFIHTLIFSFLVFEQFFLQTNPFLHTFSTSNKNEYMHGRHTLFPIKGYFTVPKKAKEFRQGIILLFHLHYSPGWRMEVIRDSLNSRFVDLSKQTPLNGLCRVLQKSSPTKG